jgi:O-antigen ligase
MARVTLRRDLSGSAAWLLAMIGFYLAVPFTDLPIFGLSLSAPVFALLVIEWVSTPQSSPLRVRWVMLALLCWAGAAASLAVAVWTGRIGEVGASELLLLIRWGYWCLVLIVVASMALRIRDPQRITTPLALGVTAAALLRLVEAYMLGVTEPARTHWLSPNDYGMSFSTFAPFLLWQAVAVRGAWRWFAIASIPLVLAALALNGSRASWASVLAGGLVFLTLLLISGHLRAMRLVWPAAAAGLALALLAAAPGLGAGLAKRWSTLSRLESDKPFQTRLALVDKGLLLFQSRPLFGVGLGRFTVERADLDSSRTPWASPEEMNDRSPHNAYIKVLAETGIAGAIPLAALLSLLLLCGIPASLALARAGETWGLAVMASLAGMCLHLVALSGLTNTAPWFIFGLAAAVIERRSRRG